MHAKAQGLFKCAQCHVDYVLGSRSRAHTQRLSHTWHKTGLFQPGDIRLLELSLPVANSECTRRHCHANTPDTIDHNELYPYSRCIYTAQERLTGPRLALS